MYILWSTSKDPILAMDSVRSVSDVYSRFFLSQCDIFYFQLWEVSPGGHRWGHLLSLLIPARAWTFVECRQSCLDSSRGAFSSLSTITLLASDVGRRLYLSQPIASVFFSRTASGSMLVSRRSRSTGHVLASPAIDRSASFCTRSSFSIFVGLIHWRQLGLAYSRQLRTHCR